MRARALLIVSLLAAASCGDATGPKLDDLQAARTRWAEKGYQLYDYRLRRLCFCPNVNPLRVSVADRAVVQVYDETQAKQIDLTFGMTVEQLFTFVENAINRKVAKIDVTYDATLGFPTFIDYDLGANAIDDELQITAGDMHQGAIVRQGIAEAAPARRGSAPAVTLPFSIFTAAP